MIKNNKNSTEICSTINIEMFDIDELVDIEEVVINPNLEKFEKYIDYLEQVKNPFCYRYKGRKIKKVYANTDKTIQDCFVNIIQNKIQM